MPEIAYIWEFTKFHVITLNFCKYFDTLLTLKCSQGHRKWYEGIKLNKYYYFLSLRSLVVSVDVKHHVYLLNTTTTTNNSYKVLLSN